MLTICLVLHAVKTPHHTSDKKVTRKKRSKNRQTNKQKKTTKKAELLYYVALATIDQAVRVYISLFLDL